MEKKKKKKKKRSLNWSNIVNQTFLGHLSGTSSELDTLTKSFIFHSILSHKMMQSK